MPVHYSIDPEAKLIVARGTGTLTNQEIVDYAIRVAQDPANGDDVHEVLDFTQADLTEVTADGVRAIAETVKRVDHRQKQTRLAICAAADVAFGLARMYQAYRGQSEREIEVFRSCEEAREWIDEVVDTEALPDR